jgi:uncharacterized protein YjbI with pentapeptide repeats
MEENFRKCTYMKATSINVHLQKLASINAHLQKVDFRICMFTEASHFRKCAFMEVGFSICAYMKVHIYGSQLRKCTFTKANFHKCIGFVL